MKRMFASLVLALLLSTATAWAESLATLQQQAESGNRGQSENPVVFLLPFPVLCAQFG